MENVSATPSGYTEEEERVTGIRRCSATGMLHCDFTDVPVDRSAQLTVEIHMPNCRGERDLHSAVTVQGVQPAQNQALTQRPRADRESLNAEGLHSRLRDDRSGQDLCVAGV